MLNVMAPKNVSLKNCHYGNNNSGMAAAEKAIRLTASLAKCHCSWETMSIEQLSPEQSYCTQCCLTQMLLNKKL